MAKSKVDIAVDYLKQRGWEFRPAEKIEGVFKPLGKYDAKNPAQDDFCLLYTSPSPRDKRQSRMPSSA